jgi:hypothetical protein
MAMGQREGGDPRTRPISAVGLVQQSLHPPGSRFLASSTRLTRSNAETSSTSVSHFVIEAKHAAGSRSLKTSCLARQLLTG